MVDFSVRIHGRDVFLLTALGYKPIPHGITTALKHDTRYTTQHTVHDNLMFGEREGGKGYHCSGGQAKESQRLVLRVRIVQLQQLLRVLLYQGIQHSSSSI